MAFGGTNYLAYLPRLRNFAAAERAYNEIKPVRGSDNVRPIGLRRRKYERIEQRMGAQGIEYHILSGGYSALIYTPDNKITVTPTPWASAQFCMWLSRILYVHAFKARHLVWLGLNGTQAVPIAGPNVKIWFDDNSVAHHNVSAVLRKAVDRKSANASRNRMKEFLDFGMSMLKVCDGVFTKELVESVGMSFNRYGPSHVNISDSQIMRSILAKDDNEYTKALIYVCNKYTKAPVGRVNGEWYKRFNAKAFKRGLYNFHDIYAPEVYYIEESPVPTKWTSASRIVGIKTLDC
jgi:hypothetical protein